MPPVSDVSSGASAHGHAGLSDISGEVGRCDRAGGATVDDNAPPEVSSSRGTMGPASTGLPEHCGQHRGCGDPDAASMVDGLIVSHQRAAAGAAPDTIQLMMDSQAAGFPWQQLQSVEGSTIVDRRPAGDIAVDVGSSMKLGPAQSNNTVAPGAPRIDLAGETGAAAPATGSASADAAVAGHASISHDRSAAGFVDGVLLSTCTSCGARRRPHGVATWINSGLCWTGIVWE